MNFSTALFTSLALALLGLAALADPVHAGCSAGHGARTSTSSYSAAPLRTAPRRAAPRRMTSQRAAPRSSARASQPASSAGVASAPAVRIEKVSKPAEQQARSTGRVVPTAAVLAAPASTPLVQASAPVGGPANTDIVTHRSPSERSALCQRYLPAVGAIVQVACNE